MHGKQCLDLQAFPRREQISFSCQEKNFGLLYNLLGLCWDASFSFMDLWGWFAIHAQGQEGVLAAGNSGKVLLRGKNVGWS